MARPAVHADAPGGELACRLAMESGLSYQDYVVLVALTDRPDGRMRLFELGGILGWETSRVSHHIARMIERGLVIKEKFDSDRRGAFVVATTLGRAEIEAAAPGHLRAVRQLFVDRLTPRQLDSLGAAAETVLAALDERDRETAGDAPETVKGRPQEGRVCRPACTVLR